MNHPFIEADQLKVSINGTLILDHLSFKVEAGTLTGIIGPNGSGKTTLLRAVSGLLPYEGHLRLDGISVDAWDKKELAQHLAVLPQNPVVAFDFEVQDYVMIGRMPHKGWLEHESPVDHQVVDQVLDALDLKGLARRTLPSLSGGERQRVLLAQALAQDTAMLLLDEPTSHLDIYHQFDLLKRIRSLVDEGKTIVIVFHNLAQAARFTDALLVLKDGRLVKQGQTRDVLDAELIRDVFRMTARLNAPADEPIHIQFIDQS